MTRAGGAAARETLDALAAALRRAVGDAVEREALALGDEAKRRCPADAGTLRESIRARVRIAGDTAEAVIGSDLPYAAKAELGALSTPPEPYLAPALDARRSAIGERIGQAVRGVLEGNKP